MFVRVRNRKLKTGKSSYAYLVENQWNTVRHKNEQKIITCLGSINDLPTNGFIEKIVCALDTFAKKQGITTLSNGVILPNLEDEETLSKSFDWGELLLIKHVINVLSLDKIIKEY